jgi:hypothetical protein
VRRRRQVAPAARSGPGRNNRARPYAGGGTKSSSPPVTRRVVVGSSPSLHHHSFEGLQVAGPMQAEAATQLLCVCAPKLQPRSSSSSRALEHACSSMLKCRRPAGHRPRMRCPQAMQAAGAPHRTRRRGIRIARTQQLNCTREPSCTLSGLFVFLGRYFVHCDHQLSTFSSAKKSTHISHIPQTGPQDPAVPIWKFLTRC